MDTIAAISTPLGEGGIGVVRVSGDKALRIGDRIFNGKMKPSSAPTHTVHYGKIIDPNTKQEIDEALLVVMKKPHTYTCEDMIEINTHGGVVALNKVLELVLQSGARNAEPGEFTRRAFISGRIDLAQAEAVLDIVRAKTDKSLSMAIAQLDGRLSARINEIKEKLISIVSQIEAEIDFPEDVEEDIVGAISRDNGISASLQHELPLLSGAIDELIKSGESGRLVREGTTVPIVGRTNVGKSSLFNAILSEDRAIVTPYPGTTRDTIEGWMSVDGIPIKLVDTAGLSRGESTTRPYNPIEQEGVKRTRKAIEEALLIIFVVDQSEGILEEDIEVLEYIKDKKIIGILNKCDLGGDTFFRRNPVGTGPANPYLASQGFNLICRSELLTRPYRFDFPLLSVSALRGDNVDLILPTISKFISVDNTVPLVSRLRHIDALRRANSAIERAQNGIGKLAPELISYEIREAMNALGEITGEVTAESILDRIFSEFCIGK